MAKKKPPPTADNPHVEPTRVAATAGKIGDLRERVFFLAITVAADAQVTAAPSLVRFVLAGPAALACCPSFLVATFSSA